MFIARWVHSFLSKRNVGDFLRLKLDLSLVHLLSQHFSGQFLIQHTAVYDPKLHVKVPTDGSQSSLGATFDWELEPCLFCQIIFRIKIQYLHNPTIKLTAAYLSLDFIFRKLVRKFCSVMECSSLEQPRFYSGHSTTSKIQKYSGRFKIGPRYLDIFRRTTKPSFDQLNF